MEIEVKIEAKPKKGEVEWKKKAWGNVGQVDWKFLVTISH